MKLLPSRLILILFTTLPVALFAAGVAYVLAPTPPDWTQPAQEPVMADRPAPAYLELDQPISVGVYNGRIQITLNLAFAARLGPFELLSLADSVKKREDAIMADLTEVILREAENATNSQNLGKSLRATLPEKLRDVVNSGLGTPEIPAPVDEVLILDLMIGQG